MRTVVACLAAIVGPAHAADWQPASDNRNGALAYVDTETVRREHGRVVAWVLFDDPTVRAGFGRSSTSQWFIRCAEVEADLVVKYNYDGPMASGNTKQVPGAFGVRFPPDSVGAHVIDMACRLPPTRTPK